MRILKLTDAVAAGFLSRRAAHDAAADRVSSRIVGDVRRHGDAALFRWSQRLDGLRLTRDTLWIKSAEIRAARRDVSRDLLRAIEHAARNIRRVAVRQRPRPWTITVETGVRVGQRVTPIESIGCYVPGGRFSLFSTLLMTAIPAQVAGVKRIVVACPKPGPALLAAWRSFLGISRIARIGGAQAIAAFAYGRDSPISRVDKICGPGNRVRVTAVRSASFRTTVRLTCPRAPPRCAEFLPPAGNLASSLPTCWRRPSMILTL